LPTNPITGRRGDPVIGAVAETKPVVSDRAGCVVRLVLHDQSDYTLLVAFVPDRSNSQYLWMKIF
jgi:hypothetical protein